MPFTVFSYIVYKITQKKKSKKVAIKTKKIFSPCKIPIRDWFGLFRKYFFEIHDFLVFWTCSYFRAFAQAISQKIRKMLLRENPRNEKNKTVSGVVAKKSQPLTKCMCPVFSAYNIM
jgi:hypothetical protein